MRVLELFGGIGACTTALKRLGFDVEVEYAEIDKFATKSFNAIHGTNFLPSDIRLWDKSFNADLIMHGSPCQDFSVAGLNKGGDEGSGTRSSLMYETLRIVEKIKPKYVIWENVKNILSKKHHHNFTAYQKKMTELGYDNFYQVLNARDYGIPQNRERVFTVSIRSDLCQSFSFPEKQTLSVKLGDILEKRVDEKYYLSERAIKCFMSNGTGNYPRRERFLSNINRKNKDIGNSVTTRAGARPTDNFIIDDTYKNREKRCYGTLSPTLRSGRNFKVAEPVIVASRGRNVENPSDRRKGIALKQRLEPRKDGVTNTITTVQKDNYVSESSAINSRRIRKLTPRECWRLMGFDDSDFNKASLVCSDNQLYKQAGNSIVVNVLEEIFAKLFFDLNFD